MQPISRNCLIVSALLALGAAAEIALVRPIELFRRDFLNTRVLRNLPYEIGPFRGTDVHNSDAELNRSAYRPAEIVYRQYREGEQPPLTLFVAPVPAGVHAGRYCARYNGYSILEQSEVAVPARPQLRISQIVLISPAGAAQACAYYWRNDERPLPDDQLRLWLNQKAALLSGRGENSFLVNVCADLRNSGEAPSSFARIQRFFLALDPAVAALFREAETGPPGVLLARRSRRKQMRAAMFPQRW